jgi:hypothetical protein
MVSMQDSRPGVAVSAHAQTPVCNNMYKELTGGQLNQTFNPGRSVDRYVFWSGVKLNNLVGNESEN